MTYDHNSRFKAGLKPGANLRLNTPRFAAQLPPAGLLVDHPGCHALWHYYITAQHNEEERVGVSGPNSEGSGKLYYEGEPNQLYNYPQLWKSIRDLHGVGDEAMANFWPVVDRECTRLHLPILQGPPRHAKGILI